MTPEQFYAPAPVPAAERGAFLITTEHLPPLTQEELDDISASAYLCLEKHARLCGMTVEEARDYYSFSVLDELLDRTLRIELPDLRALTPRLVVGLQAEALASRPLWRVMIDGESPETVVIIYPDAVRVGTASGQTDWKSALEGAVPTATRLREARRGANARQIRVLQERVPVQLANLRESSFGIVGLFDNDGGDFTELAIWMLHRGRSIDYRVTGPRGIKTSGPDFAVRADGMFGDHYQPDNADFWLTHWALPARAARRIRVQAMRDGEPIGAARMIEIDPAAIVKDADLKGVTGPPFCSSAEFSTFREATKATR
jgi:hypothetical protein